MSTITREQAQAEAEAIRTETTALANIAQRVGQFCRDMADSFQPNLPPGTTQGQALAWDVTSGSYLPADASAAGIVANITALAAAPAPAGTGTLARVLDQGEDYILDRSNAFTPDGFLIVASSGGGRWFRRSKAYVITRFGLWIVSQPVDPGFGGPAKLFCYTPGQLLASSASAPEIAIDATAFMHQCGGLSFDEGGRLWFSDLTTNPGPGQSLMFRAEHLLASGSPSSADIAVLGLADGHNNVVTAFDASGALWRSSSVSSRGTLQRIHRQSLLIGTPLVDVILAPAAGDWSRSGLSVCFDDKGNLWYSNIADPGAFSRPQVGMISLNQQQITATITPAVVWSGSNLPGTTFGEGPYGLCFGPDGYLWVAIFADGAGIGSLRAFDPHAGTGNPAPAVTLTSASFNGVESPAFDYAGNLWCMNFNDGKVMMFSRSKLAVSGAVVPDIILTGLAAGAGPLMCTFGSTVRGSDRWR